MTMVSKTALGIAVGICGTLFVGYCVYFDRQRRSDPNFKKKLRERRRANKAKSSKPDVKLPDLRNHEAIQTFFLQQIQMGEELLGQGDIQGGVEHFGNAVVVCGQPNQLLQVLQQTLPTEAFQLLLQRLPEFSRRLMDQQQQPTGGMTEDDVE